LSCLVIHYSSIAILIHFIFIHGGSDTRRSTIVDELKDQLLQSGAIGIHTAQVAPASWEGESFSAFLDLVNREIRTKLTFLRNDRNRHPCENGFMLASNRSNISSVSIPGYWSKNVVSSQTPWRDPAILAPGIMKYGR
jgi:hypothetical protein